ncbi:MAG: helix-turn-helix domain-containing protein, partial [Candidatus Methanoculleus thermohydrogenotrophicum]
MDSLIQNLVTLGLTEYEARVYAALVGMGEGTARQIHETSGVPRPRVYDIAEGLAGRGFI